MFDGALSKVGAKKVGAFRDWKEDDEVAEIFLPLPKGTHKKELVCVITSESLHVRHLRLKKTLLRAEPLAGAILPDESTWYLQGDNLLLIVLAKQWRGETKSDQYWGSFLATKDGAYECYMTVAEVAAARAARERKEQNSEAERLERVKASQAALREQERREMEAEAAEERARAQRASCRVQDLDDEDEALSGSPPPRRHPKGRQRELGAGLSWQRWTALAACFVLVPLLVQLGVDWHGALRESDEAELSWLDVPT